MLSGSIKKSDTSRLFESVIESIKAMIATNELNPGDKLPSERELADRFKVSRVPIREALKILEYVGILDSSGGDGLYIQNVALYDLNDRLKFTFSVTSKTMINLVELRIELEAFAAYYAALRRTDEDIAEMRQAIDAMRDAKYSSVPDEDQLDELRNLSQLFHRCVINAAKNNVLSSIYQNLYELLDISRQFTISTSGISYDSILAHEAIFDKIICQDCGGARICMTEHLDLVRKRLSNITPDGVSGN